MNKILQIKCGICAMFTMKHRLNKMHPPHESVHIKWSGLLVKDFVSILGSKDQTSQMTWLWSTMIY
jgi:hypothetical protein